MCTQRNRERTAQVVVDRSKKNCFEGREFNSYIPKFFS